MTDILRYKEYEGTAELAMDRCVCRGKILFIDDLVTYEADTPAGLQAAFEAAVDDYIETCQQLGREPQRAFKGLFNVRIAPELHRAAALRAVHDGVALNEVVARALDCYVHSRADVNHNHNITITLEGAQESLKTIPSVAFGETQWDKAYVLQ